MKNFPFKFVDSLERQLTSIMVTIDTIDISSSDDDVEIEDVTTHPTNLRKLPTTLSGSGTNSSFGGQNDFLL